MFNKLILKKVIKEYKEEFLHIWWKDENYKWEAVQWFQEHWDIDKDDFAKMLAEALAKTGNLLVSSNNFPAKRLLLFAEKAPEELRIMFSELYDETNDVYERIKNFKNKSNSMLKKYGDGFIQHYQNENAISVYLWLRYPDKYYIYKLLEVKAVSEKLEGDYVFKKGAYESNLRNFFSLYDEICSELKKDKELREMLNSRITERHYPDFDLRTLTMDIGFYINRYFKNSKESPNDDILPRGYWFLNANPNIWDMASMPVGLEQNYTLRNDNSNKRRIYQNFLNAKVGDMVIGYESTPVKQIVALMQVSREQDGNRIYFKKLEGLSSPIAFKALREYVELEKMEYFNMMQGSLFKLTKDEYDFIMDMIREVNPISIIDGNIKYTKQDFLKEVYMAEARYNRLVSVVKKKKNIIIQGAPGVGKTFIAKRLAYSIMGEMDEDCIEFIQFHQNYSYEDFMMGYKPTGEGFELKYGIFYKFCQKASNYPDRDYFFIIDEINRGNMSKIFGELLMLIEADYREKKATLAYNGLSFSVPKNLHIIGLMNTADRSLAMIDYALRRRFSFFNMEPGFDSEGLKKYKEKVNNTRFNTLIELIKKLNEEIEKDRSLGKGFCIGHSYFVNEEVCTEQWLKDIVDFDILPMLEEYWFDENDKLQRWEEVLRGVFDDQK